MPYRKDEPAEIEYTKITGQGAMFAEIANPTDETEAMMNELGAIVLDLKTLGDHAISKWKVDA